MQPHILLLAAILFIALCLINGHVRAFLVFVWAALRGVFHYFLFRDPHGRKSARFMNPFQRYRLLNATHKGLLIDGKSARLSPKTSFQSAVVLGGVGRGKTTRFVIPNIMTLDDCSMVITDTSGELYAQTSGHLADRGFDIRVFNLMKLGDGEQYNTLAGNLTHTSVAQKADLIVSSNNPNPKDPFWDQGAAALLRVFIQAMVNNNQPECTNLPNLNYLLARFASPATRPQVDYFIAQACAQDPLTLDAYIRATGGNEKTLQSFVSTATIALSALDDPAVSKLTARSSFDFQDLRRRKTALFIMVNQTDMAHYSFLLNLFYTDLANSLLSELNPDHLPVYALLDEFGHNKIPGFEILATTARKYRVSFLIFLQSLAQLDERYGPNKRRTILDGIQTQIYLPGVDTETAMHISRRIGRVKIPMSYAGTGQTLFRDQALMDEGEIIHMEDNEALLLHSNRHPLIFKSVPFFKRRDFLKYSKRPAYPLPARTDRPVEFLPLASLHDLKQMQLDLPK